MSRQTLIGLEWYEDNKVYKLSFYSTYPGGHVITETDHYNGTSKFIMMSLEEAFARCEKNNGTKRYA